MPSHVLTDDTQVILLLCGSLGARRGGAARPLSTQEYSRLAAWLHQRGLRPGDLLSRAPGDDESLPIAADRVSSLLERSAALALHVERWTNRGLWVIGRGDEAYPRRLRSRLGKQAPPLLYGAGDVSLLAAEGLAIVGSRDADATAEHFATLAARRCVEGGVAVISGGARGVDSIAMGAALDAGGPAIGILTDSLDRAATSGRYRGALREGRLVLASPYDPGARFNVGNAMGRNKVVYALSRWSLVVSSAEGSGGTWAGAKENLLVGWVPLFVRDAENAPAGNHALIRAGGVGLSLREVETTADLPDLLNRLATDGASRGPAAPVPTLFDAPVAASGTTPAAPAERPDLYDLAWPRIAELIAEPRTPQEIAAALDLVLGQAKKWLQRAVNQGRASKLKSPPRFQLAEVAGNQLHLLDAPSGKRTRKARPKLAARKTRQDPPDALIRQSSAA